MNARDRVRRERLIRDLRGECVALAEQRADRFIRVEHHGIVAGTTFAAASAECILLFQDGHFYGAISLAQAVGEALVRHMCQSNKFRATKDVRTNVKNLRVRGFVDGTIEKQFLKLWEKRNDYHHLNATVATDLSELEKLAYEKVRTLNAIESWVFGYSVKVAGALTPNRPQYWAPPSPKGLSTVFLRDPGA